MLGSNITNLATTAALNAKINEVKNKIPSITNLATTIALTGVENNIPKVSDLNKKKWKILMQKWNILKIDISSPLIIISSQLIYLMLG